MYLKAALLARVVAAGSFVLLAASCGGGGDGGGGSSQSPPASQPQQSPPSSQANCQPQTVVGGDLFVAEQGPVGVTLLSNGVMTAYTFSFLYDNVFGIATNNQQDKWGAVAPPPFPPGTPV